MEGSKGTWSVSFFYFYNLGCCLLAYYHRLRIAIVCQFWKLFTLVMSSHLTDPIVVCGHRLHCMGLRDRLMPWIPASQVALSRTDCYTFLHMFSFNPQPRICPIDGLVWMSLLAQDSPDSPFVFNATALHHLAYWALEGQILCSGL